MRPSIFLTACLLAALAEAHLPAAGPPAVSGQVLKQPSGAAGLAQAVVELLAPGTDQVRYRTYTDGSGKYAFPEVRPGEYELAVRYGDRLLRQVNDQGKVLERQRFKVGDQPIRLPPVTVLP